MKLVNSFISCAFLLTGCGNSQISEIEASDAIFRYHTENPICLEDGLIYFPLDRHIDRKGRVGPANLGIPRALIEALEFDGLVRKSFHKEQMPYYNYGEPVKTKTIINTHWDWIDSRVDDEGRLQVVENNTYDRDRETLCLPISGPFRVTNITPSEDFNGVAISTVTYEYSISGEYPIPGNPMWPYIYPKNGITHRTLNSSLTAWADKRSGIHEAKSIIKYVDDEWRVRSANPLGSSEQVRVLSQVVPENRIRERVLNHPKKAHLCTDDEISDTRAAFELQKKTELDFDYLDYDYIVNPENCFDMLTVQKGFGVYFDTALDNRLDMTDPLIYGEYFASAHCIAECMADAKKRGAKDIQKLDPSDWRMPPLVDIQPFPLDGVTDGIATIADVYPDELKKSRMPILKLPNTIVTSVTKATNGLGRVGYTDVLLWVADKSRREAKKSQFIEDFYAECLNIGVRRDLSSVSQEFKCVETE